MRNEIFFLSLALSLSLSAQNITATKAYVDKRDAVKRDKVDMAVYAIDWDYSVISNKVPGVYFIDDKKTIDPGHPFIPLYRQTSGAWGEVGYGAIEEGVYRILAHGSGYDLLDGLLVPRNVTAPNGDTIATMGAITNVARDVVNSLWDEEMSVTWQAKMVDGNLYYIAVTNVNLEAAQ